MGQNNSNFDDVVQTIQANGRHGGFDSPAYYGGRVYYSSAAGVLEAFTIKNGILSHVKKTSDDIFDFPGANPSISSSGSHNGIVWVIGQTNGRAVLEAYNSVDLTQQLYTSEDAGTRDQASGFVKFSTPTIADGKVFVGTSDHLEIYGLL
jgi:outer membrane protein assembly factor BamB